MPDAVARDIRRHDLLRPGERVLVAVSGGADSMALMAALRALVPEWELVLEAAHVNHLIRPEAAEDARFVEERTTEWGIPLTVQAVDVPSLATRRRLSIEAAARDARYDALHSIAASHRCARVAVGHTADDQVETLLLRLIRTGRPGGMLPRRPLDRSGSGAIDLIRPLLGIWREEVRAYLREQRISWREDPTNRDTRFLRNRIRHDLIPAIEGHIPDVRPRLKQSADALAADDAALEAAAAAVESQVLDTTDRGVVVRRDPLLRQPPALQRRLFRRAVRRIGGNIGRLRFVHFEEALRLAAESGAGRRLDLPGLTLEVRRDHLLLRPSNRQSAPREESTAPPRR